MNKAALFCLVGLCFYPIQRCWCWEALNSLFPVSVCDLLSYDNNCHTASILSPKLTFVPFIDVYLNLLHH